MTSNGKETIHSEACYCGKCIKRRHTKSSFTVFPYSKDIETAYNMHFKEKQPDRSVLYYNKSMHSSIDKGFKEHLSSALTSSQKYDYKPYKIEPHEYKKERKIEKVPFFGSSSYEAAYVDWRVSPEKRLNKVEYHKDNIPLRGSSNYKESYGDNDELSYRKFIADKPLSSLELSGAKIISLTTNKDDYKSIDLAKKQHYLTKSMDKKILEKSGISKSNGGMKHFKSQYSFDYANVKTSMNNCLYDEVSK